MLYHRAWLRQVDVVATGIHSSILVRHLAEELPLNGSANASRSASIIRSTVETNPEYLINFDPNIFELIRETKCLARLGLEIPKEAAILAQREEVLKHHYQDLSQLMEKNKQLRENIKPPFEGLLAPKFQRLNDVIKPGLTSITWTSLTIDDYVDTVRSIFSLFSNVLRSISFFF